MFGCKRKGPVSRGSVVTYGLLVKINVHTFKTYRYKKLLVTHNECKIKCEYNYSKCIIIDRCYLEIFH